MKQASEDSVQNTFPNLAIFGIPGKNKPLMEKMGVVSLARPARLADPNNLTK
jgi:hypothetical protein